MASPTRSEPQSDSEVLEQALREALGDDSQAAALLSGEAWRRLCRALEAAERLVLGPEVPADERHRAEGYRYLGRFLAAGLRSCLTHDDPDYPILGRMIDYAMPWGLNHPDCLYLYAPVRGGAHYTLYGNRGSANVFDIQVNSGHFSSGSVDGVSTLATLDRDTLETDANGDFSVRIGPDAPARNGLRVGPSARFVQIRQYFADWENERPADLLIERDGAEYPIPPPKPALVGRQLETLVHWIERGGAQWETMSKGFLSMAENSVIAHHVVGEGAHGGLSGQAYGMGNFRCDPDEAVLVRFSTPPCAHWNATLSNWYWECLEFASRQVSLNHHQAKPSSDGGYHLVIAHGDPGYANWLDPAGLSRGSLSMRFYKAEGKPDITLERLPLARLESAMPADAPRVNPDERRETLTRRRRAVMRRYRT